MGSSWLGEEHRQLKCVKCSLGLVWSHQLCEGPHSQPGSFNLLSVKWWHLLKVLKLLKLQVESSQERWASLGAGASPADIARPASTAPQLSLVEQVEVTSSTEAQHRGLMWEWGTKTEVESLSLREAASSFCKQSALVETALLFVFCF